jgi:hypothetical protein
MSEGQEPKKPYAFNFRTVGRERGDSEATDRATYQSLLSIKQSLLLLTGGCEITPRQDGYFCDKHGRPVREGESGCDYLADRFAAAVSETSSKTQMQQYVNGILGIKDPRNVKRLTG